MSAADKVDDDPPPRSAGTTDTQRRRATGQLHIYLSMALFLVVVFELNYLAYRHYRRWDWTASSVYTLSERTETEVGALSDDIDFYLFLSQGEPNYPEVKELLERYRALSPRLTVHYVDPDRDPAEYEVLAQRFGVSAASIESGQVMSDVAAVVAKGEEKWTITRDDLVGIDFGSLDDENAGPKVDVKAEQAITGAIVQLTSGEATKVCVSTGHGEWTPDAPGDRSLSAMREELQRDNIEMEEVETLGGAAIDESCNALFVIGPVRAFGPEEAAALDRYLQGGGNALLALDPVLERDRVERTGLEDLLSRFGITVDQTLVLEVDPTRLLPPGNPAGPFLVADYGEHRTMDALSRMGGAALFAMVRSVRAEEGGGADAILMTSEHAWAETDLAALDPNAEPGPDGRDIEGPVSIAVAAERAPHAGDDDAEGDERDGEGADAPSGGRIIVVGDADFLQAAPLRDPRFTNLDVALAFTGWLTERESMIAIAPKQVSAQPMVITEDDLTGWFGLRTRLLVFMPGAVILLGFAMWWSRRQ